MDDKIKIKAAPFLYTPEIIADIISPIIKDKVVCDVGCRAGVFMGHLSKYAREVIGMERDKHAATVGKERGYNIIQGNARTDVFPEADVYYVWVDIPNLIPILERLPNKPIIVGTYPNYPKIKEYLKKRNVITLLISNVKNESQQRKDFELNFLWPK